MQAQSRDAGADARSSSYRGKFTRPALGQHHRSLLRRVTLARNRNLQQPAKRRWSRMLAWPRRVVESFGP
eukprot:2004678-Pyramimonas_sp.AAC.1